MKLFFLILFLLVVPCSALTCSNVKLDLIDNQHAVITCDTIASYEAPLFLTVIQNNNTLDVSGNGSGTGYITIFDSVQNGQVSTRAGIRIPVAVTQKTIPKVTYTPLGIEIIMISLCIGVWIKKVYNCKHLLSHKTDTYL